MLRHAAGILGLMVEDGVSVERCLPGWIARMQNEGVVKVLHEISADILQRLGQRGVAPRGEGVDDILHCRPMGVSEIFDPDIDRGRVIPIE